MAYTLENLVQILEQILHPDQHHRWILDPSTKLEIESLLKKALSLKDFLGNISPLSGEKIEGLESRIREAAHEAEDILESHLADRTLSVREGESFTFSPQGLHNVIGELGAAEEQIKKMMDAIENPTPESFSSPADSSRIDRNPANILVGITEDLEQLKHRLTGHQCELEIIPIVGMGGIGKTTLASKVYDDPVITSHFDSRAWATISQDYKPKEVLISLLGCVSTGKHRDEMLQGEYDELALQLHKSLYGRRYLIVLDDMWDIKTWDDARRFLPNIKNGSRILITTRESTVANSATGSKSSHHKMNLLNEVDSWNLLQEKVFAQKTCPPELESIGKEIANTCGGLPLALHVIGGLLSQANKTQEYWTQVAKDIISSAVANKDEKFSKIFSLSYNFLPNHLKPCFLYMSTFPEDYEIRESKLIKLWVAEGFVKPIVDKSLEEVAEEYLKALVDRNLIFLCRKNPKGNVTCYGIHDLLRDLCVRRAYKDKFLYIEKCEVHNPPNDTHSFRRIIVYVESHTGEYFDAGEGFTRLARSFLYVSLRHDTIYPFALLPGFRLLRVLDALSRSFKYFPEEILQMVNLRYLALTCKRDFSFISISRLWNLQTLIVRLWKISETHSDIARAIWEMPQLRHINFKSTMLSLTGMTDHMKRAVVHEKLHTLSILSVFDIPEIIEFIPDLRKLAVLCFIRSCGEIDLIHLHKLETLKCFTTIRSTPTFMHPLIFPPSLKKLVLGACVIPLGYMDRIGILPNLEVLKIRCCTFEGPTWEAATDQEKYFCRLEYLLLEELGNLVKWVADETHFPRLESLIIRDCIQLEEIPSGIGDIPTLEVIEVHGHCTDSLVASAKKILEDQIDLGNEGFRVRINTSSREQLWYVIIYFSTHMEQSS